MQNDVSSISESAYDDRSDDSEFNNEDKEASAGECSTCLIISNQSEAEEL